MRRRGLALLATLIALTLAGSVIVSVLLAVTGELRAGRAAMGALQAEAALLSTRASLLSDSVPGGGADSLPLRSSLPVDTWYDLAGQAGGVSRTAFLAAQPGPAGAGFVRLLPLGPRAMVYPVY